MAITFNLGTTGYSPSNFKVNIAYMSEASITFDLPYDADKDPGFSLQWSVVFNGEKYFLSTLQPPAKKDTSSLKYIYSLTFKSERDALKYCEFLNLLALPDGSLQNTSYDFNFYGTLKDFVDRFNLNLQYYFGTHWYIDLNAAYTINPEPVLVSCNQVSLWQMLTQAFSLYGVTWDIVPDGDKMAIKMGYLPQEMSYVFEYGSNNGLYSIERVNPLPDIYTRLRGKGGDRNLPYRYFKGTDPYNPSFPADPDANSTLSTMYYRNLMPSVYRNYVQGWNDAEANKTAKTGATDAYYQGYSDKKAGKPIKPTDYIESDTTEKWGVRYGSLQDNTEIYPSIQGVTVTGLGRVDEVIAVESVTNDDWESVEDSKKPISSGVTAEGTTTGSSMTVYSLETESITIPSSSQNTIQSTISILSRNISSGGKAVVTIDILNTAKTVAYTKSITYNNVASYVPSAVKFENIAIGTYTVRIKVDVTTISRQKTNEGAYVSCTLGSLYLYSNATVGEFKQTFDIWIKDVWENKLTSATYDQMKAIWEPIIGQHEATVMFSTGLLAGDEYEFKIAKLNEIWQIAFDNTKTLNGVKSAWRLTLIKTDAEKQASGMYLPNKNINAKPGDKFLFINIELPYKYVVWAEERLSDWISTELEKVKDEFPTFALQPSSIFLNSFSEVDKFVPGSKIRIRDTRLIGQSYLPLYIQSISYDYTDKQILPSISVVVSESILDTESSISVIQGDIKRLSSNAYSSQQVVEMAIKLLESTYLRKDGVSDVSYSPTLFKKDLSFTDRLQTENFVQGDFGGQGGAMYVDAQGQSVVEVDKVIARRTAVFNEVVINQVSFIGGKQVYSAAGIIASRVETSSDKYRVYFDTKQGTLLNHFAVNDQALCQRFSPTDNSIIKYYWRLVTAVGTDYIELSRLDFDGTGVPEVGDEIAQLGNRSNTSRQAANIVDVVREGGALSTWYGGINGYTLVEKDQVNIGYVDGQIVVKAYGNCYFGTRDKKTYMEYKDGKLTIKGTIVQSPSGDENPVTVFRGPFDKNKVYYKGDETTNDGNSWVYINNTSSSGNTPVEGAYWTKLASKGDVGAAGKDGKDGKDGANGQNGNPGAAMVYRGVFNTNPDGTTSTLTYYGNSQRRDVMKYQDAYYIAKDTAGTFSSATFNSSYWVSFGASFESVATGLLFAGKAIISGWNFDNNVIWSQDNLVYLNGKNSGDTAPFLYAGSSVANSAPIQFFTNGDAILKKARLSGTFESTGGGYVTRIEPSQNQYTSPSIKIIQNSTNENILEIRAEILPRSGKYASLTMQGYLDDLCKLDSFSLNLSNRIILDVFALSQADKTRVIFANLPTSSTGLSIGQVYNDNGTLKIKQ